MRILHALAPAPYGGLEHVVRELARAQVRAGHEVHVAAVVDETSDEEGDPVGVLRTDGVSIHAVAAPGRSYVREYRSMAALCRRLEPDIVHTHGYRTDVIDGRAARMQGIPTVTTVHGFTSGGWRNRAYEWAQRRSFRRFDAVVAVSRAQVDALTASGIGSARLHCIPNAWTGAIEPLTREAARRALGIAEEGFVIGWVGRMSAEKGPDILLTACRDSRFDRGIQLSMIGDGALRRDLEAEASHLAIPVRWHGARSDAGVLFRAFDVFVLSSRTEGTPIVLFEAMASEVPIVAASVGGVPDVLTGSEAELIRPEDPTALARAILNVRADPGAARQRAAAARRRLDAHGDISTWLGRYEFVYRSVQNNGTRRRF